MDDQQLTMLLNRSWVHCA